MVQGGPRLSSHEREVAGELVGAILEAFTPEADAASSSRGEHATNKASAEHAAPTHH